MKKRCFEIDKKLNPFKISDDRMCYSFVIICRCEPLIWALDVLLFVFRSSHTQTKSIGTDAHTNTQTHTHTHTHINPNFVFFSLVTLNFQILINGMVN